VSFAHRKIAHYFEFMDGTDRDGHGTHCAGTTAGSTDAAQPGVAALAKYQGMAPQARLAIWDHECAPGQNCSCPVGFPCTCDLAAEGECVGSGEGENDGHFTMPLDVWQTQQVLYDAGARVSSNSWDDSDLYRDQVQYYTQTASDFDAWLYAHDDFLAVFAAANSGRADVGVRFASVGVPGLCKNTLTIGATQHDALAHVDLLRVVNNVGAGRSCRRLVMGFFNSSAVDTCALAATGRSCYALAFETARDARAAVADVALCCGCSLADVLASAPPDAATQRATYVALLTAYARACLRPSARAGRRRTGARSPT
jgi:hypothetical protein